MFSKLIKWFSGRHTLFAFLELVLGTILAWFGHLTMEYVALVGTIQGMVLGHSIKEDWFEAKTSNSGANSDDSDLGKEPSK